MNRSVLIVTPYFAPQSHAAMFRAYKLAKYLPRFGWKPYVLTVDTNYLYNVDPSLLAELPPEVDITTARYIEPTLRGLRMALGGRDRSFTATKQSLVGESGATERGSSVLRDVGERTYQYLREAWLQTPDPYWTWYRPALRKARRLVEAHDISIVYTTCLPFTCNQIGKALQLGGVKWVADFRDPPTYSARMSSPIDRVYLRQRRIERETLRRADAVTTLSSSYELIFKDMYGPHVRGSFQFIPTGLDEAYLPTGLAPLRTHPYIVFAGEYLPEYGSRFLEAFAMAQQHPDMKALGMKLLVIGRSEVNRPCMWPTLERLGLWQAVEFLDHMPQRELYAVLKSARAGALIPGSETHWWTNFAKMVDYIALRIPTLAIVPDPSEARTRLTRAGLGIFLDGDVATASATLTDFLTGQLALPTPNPAECDRYLATHQVESFVKVFEEVLS